MNIIRALFIPPLCILTACGGGGGGSGSESSGALGPAGNSRCFINSMTPQPLVNENFGSGNSCGFTANWDFVEGSVGDGIDSCSLQYVLTAGETDEVTPAQVQFNSAQMLAATGSERQQYLRVQWQDYFEPGFQFAKIGQKLARFYDSSGGQSSISVAVGNENTNLELFFNVSNRDESREYFRQVTHSYGGVPVGEVITFDLEAQLPSSNSVGFARLRYNGNEIYFETDSQVEPLLRDGCLDGFSGFWVGGNFSNMGEPVSKTSYRFIDSVSASAAY